MDDDIKEIFVRADGARKVEIFQREDQTFGFAELEFGSDENSWYPVGKYSFALLIR